MRQGRLKTGRCVRKVFIFKYIHLPDSFSVKSPFCSVIINHTVSIVLKSLHHSVLTNILKQVPTMSQSFITCIVSAWKLTNMSSFTYCSECFIKRLQSKDETKFAYFFMLKYSLFKCLNYLMLSLKFTILLYLSADVRRS